jgi:hypothetical protein
MTPLQSAYIALSKASGIKVGDTVKVLRKAKSNEMGWANWWDSGNGGAGVAASMDNCVGKTFTVSDIGHGTDGIVLEGTGYCFPFFVLEKMPKPKPVVPVEKCIQVNGALVGLKLPTSGERIIIHIDEAGYQFGVEDLKDIIKEANKFLKQHRDAKKAS